MRNEIWKDDELVDVIITDDIEEEYAAPQEVTISLAALDNLQSNLEDPSTNTIAKMKLALTEFLQELRG